MEERRQHKRIKKKVRSELHTDNHITMSLSADLGKGGIFISTPEPIVKGAKVDIELHLPGKESIQCKGIIRWTREEESTDEKIGMGIEFLNLPKETEEELEQYSLEDEPAITPDFG